MAFDAKKTEKDLEIMDHVAVIAQTAGTANKTEQNRLNLSAADPVLRLKRIRYQQERPVSYEEIVLLLTVFPGLDRNREITLGISELASQHALTLGRATERASIVGASKTVAAHLAVAEGVRVMKLDRVVATADGQLVEWHVAFVIVGIP